MPWPTFALKRFASALEKEGVASKAMLEVGRPAKGLNMFAPKQRFTHAQILHQNIPKQYSGIVLWIVCFQYLGGWGLECVVLFKEE